MAKYLFAIMIGIPLSIAVWGSSLSGGNHNPWIWWAVLSALVMLAAAILVNKTKANRVAISLCLSLPTLVFGLGPSIQSMSFNLSDVIFGFSFFIAALPGSYFRRPFRSKIKGSQ